MVVLFFLFFFSPLGFTLEDGQEKKAHSDRSPIDEKVMREKIWDQLREEFKPEFLNRLDEIIVFHPLTPHMLVDIVDIQLARVRQHLAHQGLVLKIEEAAKKLLAKQGYDPQFGARPLKRLIQQVILNPLAREIISRGEDEAKTVAVKAKDDKIAVEVK